MRLQRMPTRQRIATYGFTTAAAATITVALLLQPWRGERRAMIHDPAPPRPPAPTKHPVDVVFAVDTTGSMGGLIEGAKRTVWSIATHIRNTDPQADLRIGLVAYRDIGDVYVTKPFPLTGDLDGVYGELSKYRADGGGDTPEDVDAAVNDALRMQWRPGAQKLMFVVGDAPPASRGEVPTFDVLAQQAADRGILVNTIRCGWDPDTATTFQRMASIGKGEFSTISQDGGVQQVATPYDDKLAELSGKIDRTTIIVGDDSVRAGYSAKMAAAEAAPAPAKADRASYYAKTAKMGPKGASKRADADLVDGVVSGAINLETVPATSLPADLREKNKDELKAEVARRTEERQAAQKEIDELTRERDKYLADHAKTGGEAAFDVKVKATVEKQLKK